jgi:hypothetical protein
MSMVGAGCGTWHANGRKPENAEALLLLRPTVPSPRSTRTAVITAIRCTASTFIRTCRQWIPNEAAAEALTKDQVHAPSAARGGREVEQAEAVATISASTRTAAAGIVKAMAFVAAAASLPSNLAGELAPPPQQPGLMQRRAVQGGQLQEGHARDVRQEAQHLRGRVRHRPCGLGAEIRKCTAGHVTQGDMDGLVWGTVSHDGDGSGWTELLRSTGGRGAGQQTHGEERADRSGTRRLGPAASVSFPAGQAPQPQLDRRQQGMNSQPPTTVNGNNSGPGGQTSRPPGAGRHSYRTPLNPVIRPFGWQSSGVEGQ